tara:strand:- start:1113 stop:3083 length:1971 start_codon:yes stop_codon:yes gene_type:complete
MADVKNLLLATAGNAGGAGLNVEQVFRSFPYDGNGGSGNNIVNGIDLSNEGGWVWFKRRNGGNDHFTVNSAVGVDKYQVPNSSSSGGSTSNVTFNSNGFTLNDNLGDTNESNAPYSSWTFRKAPKFFDMVTFTGNGANRTIAHNLGSVPGMIIVKKTSASGDWGVYHRGAAANVGGGDSTDAEDYYFALQKADARQDDVNWWNDTAPTSSVFSLGPRSDINEDGQSFVAYLFAHNDGDGNFGETGDQDIIKCGSYNGNGTSQEINLGFEPQWIMWRCASQNFNDWKVIDDMRGLGIEKSSKDDYRYLRPNSSSAELGESGISITPTGYRLNTSSQSINGAGEGYIFIAIRRDMAVPTSRAEVYDISQNFLSSFSSVGNRVDMVIGRSNQTSQNWRAFSRYYETGFLRTEDSAAISYLPDNEVQWDSHDGFYQETNGTPNIWWQWRRAPKFFDMVPYIGNNTARTISHNLGVAPEMMWIKKTSASGDWLVYHTGLTNNNHYIVLNSGADEEDFGSGMWNNTAPTDSVFSIGSHNHPNANNAHYIAYLFASLDGISKIGTYDGNGSSTGPTIDCGFSSGPKWVMIKRLDAGSNDHWAVFDTTRGLSSGNDFYIAMSNTDAEFSNVDWIDPTNAGFQVVQSNSAVNDGSSKYIFYAIAA